MIFIPILVPMLKNIPKTNILVKQLLQVQNS